MQHNTITFIILGFFSVLLTPSMLSATIIDCASNSLKENAPRANRLCTLFEQALISDAAAQQNQFVDAARPLEERYANTKKRQDVDHVFLRFGRQFGL